VASVTARLASHWELQYLYWDGVARRIEAAELARVQVERRDRPKVYAGNVTPEWYDVWAALRTNAEHKRAVARRDAARVKAEHYALLALADTAIRGEVSWPTPSDASPTSTPGP
jgi:hypothetical protein